MKQKEKYIGQKKNEIKKYLFFLIIILACILSVFLILLNYEKTKELIKKQDINSENFKTLQEIFEYYECNFISEKRSSNSDFKLDIEVEFKLDLYEDGKSNELFYNEIIEKVAALLGYDSFRVFDYSKNDNIEIEVICENKKVKKIYINGVEDYYNYINSKNEYKNFKTINLTEINIDSQEIINCINNNWSSKCEFGTRESIFQNYDIYLDEGIKVRKINGKIFNIIFTDKYKKSVLNNFTVGTKSDIIKGGLGEPTFYNEDNSVIGYKTKDIYIFFEENQISIYRNITEVDLNNIIPLIDELVENKRSIKDFMNELTYIWPDYEEYDYNSSSIFISYPNKGLDIKVNYDETNGIILYNNIVFDKETLNKYLLNTNFVAKFQLDNIFEAEKRRIKKEDNLIKECEKFEESNNNLMFNEFYGCYAHLDSNNNIMNFYFISKDNNCANCELNERINTYIWLNDFCFVYSKKGKGIYYFDLKTQNRGCIISGDKNFEIKSYENGILKYDDNEIEVKI